MIKQLVLAGVCLSILTACETTPNPYPNGPGFYETQIERDRVRITYVVPNGMPRPRAEDFLMLRAADDTLNQGFTWFRIVGRSDAIEPRGNQPRLSIGTGTTSFGGNTAIGLGLGTSVPIGPGPHPLLNMEIIMGSGDPPDDPGAYDASDVAQTIRSRL